MSIFWDPKWVGQDLSWSISVRQLARLYFSPRQQPSTRSVAGRQRNGKRRLMTSICYVIQIGYYGTEGVQKQLWNWQVTAVCSRVTWPPAKWIRDVAGLLRKAMETNISQKSIWRSYITCQWIKTCCRVLYPLYAAMSLIECKKYIHALNTLVLFRLVLVMPHL